MRTYLVEAYVTRLDESRRRQLATAARAAAESTSLVRYLGSMFVPEDETCFHLLQAPSREAIGGSALAFERIVEVIESRPPVPYRKEPEMPQYMVERRLRGFPPEQLPAAAAAAKNTAKEISAEGTDVHYVRSTYIPGTEQCYCLFEAASREAVEHTQERAGLPYEQIHDAAFLIAEQV
jgi:Protein of unknown function (DUF4242)